EEFIQQRLVQDRMREKTAAIRRDPFNHPLRKTLLKIPLLPYQLDGVAFAAGAGRAVLADDMGLGKTIQGVGAAEFLAREAEIKNCAAKTSNVIKSLKSRFALVLSGTPLENRLDELYSVVQFIDGWRLGPGFRFFNKHRVVDEKGKVLGYKNLGELREALKPILLRRTRDSVKLELPPRTIDTIRIAPTDEQLVIHRTHMQVVASITSKKFISEM